MHVYLILMAPLLIMVLITHSESHYPVGGGGGGGSFQQFKSSQTFMFIRNIIMIKKKLRAYSYQMYIDTSTYKHSI